MKYSEAKAAAAAVSPIIRMAIPMGHILSFA
jgi:hypothetical protein